MVEVVVKPLNNIIEVIETPIIVEILGSGSGTIVSGGITAINVGTGTGIYKQLISSVLEFKSLLAGSGITITPGPNEVTISTTAQTLSNILTNGNSAAGFSITNLGAPLAGTSAARLQDIPSSLPPSGAASGDLTGTYPAPTLTTTGVSPGTYGDGANYAIYTVDAKGRITSASQLALPTSLPPNGTAGGDLSGTYPNPSIATAAVTYAKIQDVTGDRLLGRIGTTGDVQEITLGAGLQFVGGALVVNEFDPLGWLTDGNAVGTVKSIGTTTSYDFPIITANAERMRFKATGLINFTSVSENGALDKVLVIDNIGDMYWRTLPSATSGHVIMYNAAPLTDRANLNFLNGLTASDNDPYTDVKWGGPFTDDWVLAGNISTGGFLRDVLSAWVGSNSYALFSGDMEENFPAFEKAITYSASSSGYAYSGMYNMVFTASTDRGRSEIFTRTRYISGADYIREVSLSIADGGTSSTALQLFQSNAITTPKIEAGSDHPTFAGVTYGADYSTNYTARSLVDKAYVDSLVAASGWAVTGNTTLLGASTILTTTTNTVTFSLDDASTNTVLTPVRLRRTTSGTPAAGIGVGLSFETETATGENIETIASIQAYTTDVGTGAEISGLVFYGMQAGIQRRLFDMLALSTGVSLGTASNRLGDIKLYTADSRTIDFDARSFINFTNSRTDTTTTAGWFTFTKDSQFTAVHTDSLLGLKFTSTGNAAAGFGARFLHVGLDASTSVQNSAYAQDVYWSDPTNGAASATLDTFVQRSGTLTSAYSIYGGTDMQFQVYGPLKIMDYTTVGLPAAASHPYALVYDTDTSSVKVSDGASWGDLGGAAKLNSLLAADGSNTINNANFTQTWQWNSLTSQTGLSLSSTSGITTGSLLRLTWSGTSEVSTNGAVLYNFTGAYTSFDPSVGAFNINANSTVSGTVMSINANALNNGYGLHIKQNASGIAAGGLLRVETATTNTMSGGALQVVGSANFGSSSNTGLLGIQAFSTTGGTAFSIKTTSMTTGVGAYISHTGTGLTTGSLIRATTSSTGALTTNGAISLSATGAFTYTSAAFVDIKANATVTGRIMSISGTALSGGTGLYINTAAGQESLKIDSGIAILDEGAVMGGTSLDASAILQTDSTTKGLLLPRMTGTQVEAIGTPATGLTVYSTDGTGGTVNSAGWWGYNGAAWVKINGGATPPSATTTVEGIVELATEAEVDAGTDTTRVVTPETATKRAQKTSTQNITGAVSIDLSTAEIFFLTLTGNVTSFTFTNEKVGKQYMFVFIKGTTEYTLSWTAGKFRSPFGNMPVLTDPTANGTSGPTYSRDIITAICTTSGKLDIAYTPDLQDN